MAFGAVSASAGAALSRARRPRRQTTFLSGNAGDGVFREQRRPSARVGGGLRPAGQALNAMSFAIVFALRAVPMTPRRFSNHPACSFDPPMPSG